MRSRNIKPGFFKNDLLAEIDPLGRILFIGLWCMADRQGRLEHRPKKIKAEVMPYDNCNINKLLKDLEDKNFIQLYSVNSCNYIQIVNFTKHQTPHIKEQASTIPAPDMHGNDPVKAHLIPDILIPDILKSDTCPKPIKAPDRFPEFYMLYPKHVARAEAEKAWNKRKFSEEQQSQIIDSLKKQIAGGHFATDKQYIASPAVWLNQARWDDEIINRNSSKPPARAAPPGNGEYLPHWSQKDIAIMRRAKLGQLQTEEQVRYVELAKERARYGREQTDRPG